MALKTTVQYPGESVPPLRHRMQFELDRAFARVAELVEQHKARERPPREIVEELAELQPRFLEILDHLDRLDRAGDTGPVTLEYDETLKLAEGIGRDDRES